MKPKDKAKIDALNKERDKLIKSIQTYQDKINEIGKEIREINLKHYQRKLKEIGVENGAVFVGFAKECGYHYDMIKAIKVINVSKNPSAIQCVVATYRADDYDFSFRTSEQSITVRSLSEFCDDNIVYRVNHGDYMLLLEHMAGLAINFDNVVDVMSQVDSWDESKRITRIKE